MCDDEIHQGLGQGTAQEPGLSRRAFGVGTAAVVGFPATASAQAQVVQRDVDVKTPDGTADSVLFYPAGPGSWPAVLIWTDILGLRPVFRDMGRRLAAEGYVVLVPNPFYRVRRAPITDPGFDFNKPDDRAKVMPLGAALTAETTQRDAPAFFAFLDAQPQTNLKAKGGVQGYCMGGPLTFRTAAALPARIGAGATFHGGGLVTDKPDSPHLLVAEMKARLYCGVADNDDKREPKAKDVLKTTFETAKLPGKVEVYAGANHGWCVKDSAVYNEAAAERAWGELTALYKGALA